MTRSLHMGEDLALPLDVVSRRTAVVGQSGTGKTSTAVVLVEEAPAAGAQVVVLEPSGAWWGVTSSADGGGPGLDMVVMGGEHGEVPLNESAGRAVARLVADKGYSAVLDLDRPHFVSWGSRLRFAADFLSELYELAHSQILVVIDECHRFAPQSVREEGGNAARCLGAVVDVVALGRRRGLGVVAITQRLAKLHKDVLELCEVMVAHRLRGNNDRKALQGWLENADEDVRTIMAEVARLENGLARVSAPTLGVEGVYRIRPKQTFDSSRTPEVGETVIEPTARTRADLDELRSLLADTIAEAEADDPERLRGRIAELEAQLRDGGGGVDLEEHVAVTRRVEDLKADLAERTQRTERLEGELRRVEPILVAADRIRQAYDAFLEGRDLGHLEDWQPTTEKAPGQPDSGEPAGRGQPSPAPPRPSVERRAPVEPESGAAAAVQAADAGRDPSSPAPSSPSANGDAPPLKAGARRMLVALTRAPRPLTRDELGSLAVVSKGGTFSTYLGAVLAGGYVTETERGIVPTEAGVALAIATHGGHPAPLEPDDVVALHARALKAGARRMLSVLMRAHPNGFTRAELSRLADVSKGGTFSTYLGALSKRGLAVEKSKRVYAGPILYLWKEQP